MPFYQNHRLFTVSKDFKQLLGNRPIDVQRSPCKDLTVWRGIEIAPCGHVANAFFNDSFIINIRSPRNQSVWYKVPLLNDHLIDPISRLDYRNPEPRGNLTVAFAQTVKPLSWSKRVEQLNPRTDNNGDNYGYEFDPLISWMSLSPLPDIYHIYARVGHISHRFDNGSMPIGTYRLLIRYNYHLWHRQARKSLQIANISTIGHQNYSLANYFLYIGCICLGLSLLLIVAYLKFDRPVLHQLNKLGIQTCIRVGFVFQWKV